MDRMAPSHLEPAAAGRVPSWEREEVCKGDGTRPALPLLREGDKVVIALDATILYPPREIDGRCLVETDEGVYLLVDRFRVERRA